jgi:hypothetical protein
MARRLCVDPGETVGWSIWTDKGKLLGGGQTPLWTFAMDVWAACDANEGPLAEYEDGFLRDGIKPEENVGSFTKFVIEKFTLYPWEAKNLAWDEFRTSQLIGALTFIAAVHQIDVHKQPATIKERALAGGASELFVKPVVENRHTNDSIMHGWFYEQSLKGNRIPKVKDGFTNA